MTARAISLDLRGVLRTFVKVATKGYKAGQSVNSLRSGQWLLW